MILVTGASGFIGKHLIQALQFRFGFDHIIALTSAPMDNCRYLLHENYNFSSNFFINNGYSAIYAIIHLGAFIPKSAQDSDNFQSCNENIINTEKIISSKLPNLKRFIFASTVDVYDAVNIIDESTPIKPVSIYGLSKYYCEKMIEVWAKKDNILLQILRIGHIYGPGEEKYQKLIPNTIRRIIEKKNLEIWGTGRELRSFLYVDDLIASILKSLELETYVGPINLVSNLSISVESIIDKLIEISDIPRKTSKIKQHLTKGRDCIFDNKKMKAHLPTTETALETGLLIEFEYMKTLFAK